MNILITGAAQGIGLAAAQRLAGKGHQLGLFDVNVSALKQLTNDKAFKKLNKQKGLVIGSMDVTKPEDWDSAIHAMTEQLGSIDVLINNAGILVTGSLPETSLAQQLALVDINCKGVLIGCHKVADAMRTQSATQNAKIINLSSASAIYGQPLLANYSASKFYIRGLTEALNLEYEPYGIKVVDVMPLWTKTKMTDDIKVPNMQRLGIRLTAEDVAKTLCRLVASPNAKLTKVHYPVGLSTTVFEGLAQVTPSKVTRWVNQKMGM